MNYTEGTALYYWFENWLVVIGFAVSLALALWIASVTGWRIGGLLMKTLMAAAVLAALPLTLLRVGMDISVSDDLTVGYLSMGGVLGSLVLGPLYFLGRLLGRIMGREKPREPETGYGSTAPQGTAVTGITSEGETQAVAGQEAAGATQDASAATEATATAGYPGAGEPTATMGVSGEGETMQVAEGVTQPRAWLVVQSGAGAGSTLDLKAGDTTLGRSRENDYPIDDPTVSRQHAQIRLGEEGFVIYDRGSTSGTKVNGQDISRQVFRHEDLVTLGESTLVFMQPGGASRGLEEATAIVAQPGAPAETMIVEEKPGAQAWLVIKSGPSAGTTFQLKAEDTTLGRDSNNDRVVTDASVSRQHVLIRHREGQYTLYDLASTSGTHVNRDSLGGRPLQSNDVVTMGRTEFQFLQVETEGGMAEPPPGVTSERTMVLEEKPSVVAWLVAKSGPDAGKALQLRTGDTTFGREPESDHVLQDPAVSRSHALVRFHEGRFTLHGMASRGGTKVNGEALVGRVLQANDVITLGRTELAFMRVETQSS